MRAAFVRLFYHSPALLTSPESLSRLDCLPLSRESRRRGPVSSHRCHRRGWAANGCRWHNVAPREDPESAPAARHPVSVHRPAGMGVSPGWWISGKRGVRGFTSNCLRDAGCTVHPWDGFVARTSRHAAPLCLDPREGPCPAGMGWDGCRGALRGRRSPGAGTGGGDPGTLLQEEGAPVGAPWMWRVTPGGPAAVGAGKRCKLGPARAWHQRPTKTQGSVDLCGAKGLPRRHLLARLCPEHAAAAAAASPWHSWSLSVPRMEPAASVATSPPALCLLTPLLGCERGKERWRDVRSPPHLLTMPTPIKCSYP